jgi:hypothetical protein
MTDRFVWRSISPMLNASTNWHASSDLNPDTGR